MITGLITEGKSPWEQVFTPQRFNPSASARTLMRDTAQAAKGLARKFLTPPREDIEALPRGHGGRGGVRRRKGRGL